ncbi:hypothetical protein [Sandarakinorhabdus sp.]|uniref:hypothetical protein n=1 Tax=Sandarakinorhabdus sp. TaxID=1916663 RepID=UPI00286DE615|nr:hypothetical protein [Sandarakinorhabdus sp.]
MLDLVKAWRGPLLLLALAGALMTLVKCAEGRVNGAWQAGQSTAVVAHTGAKRVTEAAAGQASARIGEKVDADIADVRRSGAAARQRVRGKAGAAGRTDLPSVARCAVGTDAAAGAEIVVVEDPELRLQLVDVAEEGDVYRAQVMGWQAWWREQKAAWALGAQVTGKPPDDAR